MVRYSVGGESGGLKYPLDRICVKSGILCPNCQRKVNMGIVGEYEIPVMKAMMELEEEMKELRKGEYIKAYDLGDQVIILVKGIDNPVERDRIGRRLSSRLHRRVKIVNYTPDKKQVVEQIISPATLLGLNTLWLPDGTEQVIVRIPRRDKRYLRDRLGRLEELLSKIFDKPVRFRFEAVF